MTIICIKKFFGKTFMFYAYGLLFLITLYFCLMGCIRDTIPYTEPRAPAVSAFRTIQTYPEEPKPPRGNKTRAFIHRERIYFSPLQALIDQNRVWLGGFKNEITYLKTRGNRSEPVKFEMGYPANAHLVLKNTLPSLVVTPEINCAKLIQNDPMETIKAELVQKRKWELMRNLTSSDFQVYQKTQDCEKYKKDMDYINYSVTAEEEDFPIAYSILMYKNAGQTERLLRAIYRPQNYYCIHVDSKANTATHYTMHSLARCFNNVFIASRLLPVNWGKMSVLEAEFVCMKDLWEIDRKKKKQWKYFINLTGQEFPLKTNWELVQILKSYKGANDIGHTASRSWLFRTNCSYDLTKHPPFKCKGPKHPLPYNYTIGKGPVHVALTREFVDFCLHDEISLRLFSWLNDTLIPDETFFQTLFLSHHLGVPGAYTGETSLSVRNIQPPVRFKKWDWWRPCRGEISTRHICIMTVWDLPELAARPEMFVNKFNVTLHPLAYSCLEELHRNRTREDIMAARSGYQKAGDDGYELPYSRIPWVQKHI